MKQKGFRKAAAAKQTPIMAACKGMGLCAVMTALLCALFAFMTRKGVLPQTMTGAGGSVAAALASLLGAFLAAKEAKGKKLIFSLIVCGAYAVLLLLVNVLFFRISAEGVLRVLLPVLAAGVLGGVLGSTGAGKRRGRRK